MRSRKRRAWTGGMSRPGSPLLSAAAPPPFTTLTAWIGGIVRDLAACQAGATDGQGRRWSREHVCIPVQGRTRLSQEDANGTHARVHDRKLRRCPVQSASWQRQSALFKPASGG